MSQGETSTIVAKSKLCIGVGDALYDASCVTKRILVLSAQFCSRHSYWMYDRDQK